MGRNKAALFILLALPAAALAGNGTEGATPPRRHVSTLTEQWTPSEQALRMYKQTYFLAYSYNAHPNDAPTSPNQANQGGASYPLDHKEMKFQISVKGHMLGEDRTTLWFGYTQLSFWQFYDFARSQPFRENNFEPELILSHRPQQGTASFINLAFVHQSNGQALPRSRAWNRLYLQAGFQFDLDDGHRLDLLPRVWHRLGGGGIDDDNPDIVHYLGHGDLELRYHHNDKAALSALARSRSLQLDLTLSTELVTGLLHHTDLHLQYFTGYGESLIDYNHKHHTVGIGISMPIE
jgi:phospholipase A1